MEDTVSLTALKALVEMKMKKKTLIKVMWDANEKLTLFITPNMKINSFIYDEKDGYLFYDDEGKLIENDIPCILPEEGLVNGKVLLEGSKLMVDNQPLSKEEITFLREYHS